jgi:hypothetical protein
MRLWSQKQTNACSNIRNKYRRKKTFHLSIKKKLEPVDLSSVEESKKEQHLQRIHIIILVDDFKNIGD